ncbi:uncharacterized protein LOC110975359 [Acanthaster planci]|uniref:Uncharacterized protein LOC110975359 n=1 Tax=Acanthaster planci TaxID=133434 RepID=A0A8B7XU09_ACAPL|nr:uncharacterized protein LOC110975359 [Acanthaster planci]
MDGTSAATKKGVCWSRKRVFSFCLVALAVCFAIIILGGQNQTGVYKFHRWLDPGARYQSGAENLEISTPMRIQDQPGHSDGGFAKVRSDILDSHDHDDDFFKIVPVLAGKGATYGESEQTLPTESAAKTETEFSDLVSGTSNSPFQQSAAAEGVGNDIKSVPRNKINATVGDINLETRRVPSIVTKQAIQRKVEYIAGLKESVPVKGSFPDHPKMSVDRNNGTVPFRRKVSVSTQATQTFIPAQTTAEAVYYDICAKCCYRYTTINNDITKVLDESQLRERGCQRRLPDAMIFGVKKGGTTTLKNFLSYHPDIAFTQEELKFFTSSKERAKGLEYYRSRMIYSTPDQISMEKTPAYSHYPKVPAMIANVLPDVKLIIIMRDPVERAVSDYVHMQVTIAKRCHKLGTSTLTSLLTNITLPKDCDFFTRYEINSTFDESVIDSKGRVKDRSQLISKGVYVKDIQRYLDYFKPEQILAIDGEAFILDPYPAVKKVEQFLGIRDYFMRDHFYFDVQKGFYCLNKPIPNNCMCPAKGRPHPRVHEDTLRKLRDFYRPYNAELKQLTKLDLHWSS